LNRWHKSSLNFLQNDENRVDVSEGQVVSLQLERGSGAAGIVNISWQAVPHQAGLQDFAPSSGQVTFNIDEQFATIFINIFNDAGVENLEVIISTDYIVY